MNIKTLSALLLIQIAAGICIAPAHAGTPASLDEPPASLEKWYKPANERQVWLHTMFRLRREMQAISEYAEKNEYGL